MRRADQVLVLCRDDRRLRRVVRREIFDVLFGQRACEAGHDRILACA